MNPKLPSRIMLAGLIAIGISGAAKDITALSILGRSSIFEWGCGIVTALSFSAGMFLSLCGLLGPTDRRRTFFALHLIGLLTFCSMLGLYFLGYVTLTKIYGASDDIPNVLPKLVENARTADSESKRELMAQNAYKIYGSILAYRRDSGELVYYQPTSQDIAYRDQIEKETVRDEALRDSIVKEQLRQFPWLFGFYLGGFFIVYLAGTLWLLFRKPGPRP